MGFWPVVLNVLKNSDVVLLVVDARTAFEDTGDGMQDTGGEILKKVDKMGKRLIYVFNKVDLVGDLGVLKRRFPRSFFVSCKKRKGIGELRAALVEIGSNWKRSSLRVGIVGYPNVGKSALVNRLVPGAGVKVSGRSGTTRKTKWIRFGKIRIMDSPGVIPFGDSKVKVGVIGGKNADKMRDVEKVAFHLLSEDDTGRRVEAIKKFYDVEGDGAEELFEAIGRKKGFLVKGGVVDENRTAVRIVEDWQKGKIALRD